MTLNQFGKLAIAEIVFYIPIIVVAFIVTLRHGFNRKAGWVLLLSFAVIRFVGSILAVVAQDEANPSSTLLTVAGILQALGLSPLLLATFAFISKLVDMTLPHLSRLLNLVRIILVVGLILAIIGGTDQTPGNSQSSQNDGHTLSKVSSILYLVGYLALFGVHVLLWSVREDLPAVYRKFLLHISIALPFLAVPVLYFILGSFKPNSKFSPTTGDWRIYLVMDLIMEYIVVCIYIVSGITIPHREEEAIISTYNQGATYDQGTTYGRGATYNQAPTGEPFQLQDILGKTRIGRRFMG
ncbi:hypothetical protein Clacol_002946 [Clathrus columnatus]|uniref:DUF7702 domain-containing protein n=1 Tax=Clathrus columnatus TaxID=1419009 RepID=A0AAV5A5G6_9AGAM|nr:hypothetical protein Clacol_002946 [Clathrus columnatus]